MGRAAVFLALERVASAVGIVSLGPYGRCDVGTAHFNPACFLDFPVDFYGLCLHENEQCVVADADPRFCELQPLFPKNKHGTS